MTSKKKAHAPEQEIVNHRRGRLVLPCGTILLPGANTASPETVRLVRSNDITQAWLKRGFISLRDKVLAGSVEYDLSWGLPTSIVGLDHETITAAIAKCESKDQLFKWLEGASDDLVRTMITDRAYALTFEEAQNLAESP